MDTNAMPPAPTPVGYVPYVPPTAPPKKKTHIWLIVLGVLVILAVLLVGFVVSIFYGVMKVLRSSDVYKMSLQDAHASPCVVTKLGEPFDASGGPDGNINEKNSEGDADITIPLKGPNGAGTLHSVASRAGGVWTITTLALATGGTTVNILPTPSPCQ